MLPQWVLTPAVFAAAKKADMKPLPLLFVCAFIANAASFVLPISNPANLVLYGNHTPALLLWMRRFIVPSVLSICATYFMLRWSQRHNLRGECKSGLDIVPLSSSGRIALGGIVVTAIVLLLVSAFDMQLGVPTVMLGATTAAIVFIREWKSPWVLVKDISWSVLPLVTGLFVLVEVLQHTGVIDHLAKTLESAAQHNESSSAGLSGGVIAIASNLLNNLPAGLISSATAMQAHSPERIRVASADVL